MTASLRTLLLCMSLLASVRSWGQEMKLALQYYSNGEYEKSASLYKKLWEGAPNNENYFNYYIGSLLELKDYVAAIDVVKFQVKKNSKDVSLLVTYGNILSKQGKEEEAQVQYNKAVSDLGADDFQVYKLGNAFMNIQDYDHAIAVYEKASANSKNGNYVNSLADLYYRKGDIPKMIDAYLSTLIAEPGRLTSIESFFLNILEEKDYEELKLQTFDRLQANSEETVLIELLTWLFYHQKDYANALRQAKALDKRLQENGARPYQIGAQALQEKKYDAAIQAFEYITLERGTESALYFEARKELLKARRLKITDSAIYAPEDLVIIRAEYEAALSQLGFTASSGQLMLEYAQMLGLYVNDIPASIKTLRQLVDIPGLNRNVQAEAKLLLGDLYLITDEVWESTLLYSQVDKDFAEDPLGHEARFRNAKLSYYNSDFEWAQSQFDILKSSTSKLIANDALDLSVFIMDNMGLDTSTEALSLYAGAELLFYQNKFEQAFLKLDTLNTKFPEHSLTDDILYLKAKIYRKRKLWPEAIEAYIKVFEKFAEDIRADNAMYELADMYELQLMEKDKARDLFEQVFTKFPGSVFATDARKRYRSLRGDKVVQ